MNENQKQKATKKFNNFSQNANEKDVKKIDSKLGGMNKGKLAEVWDKVTLLWKLVKDPEAAWKSKALAIGALLYVISPIDAIPDFIPVFGLGDDVSVVLLAVASLANELNKYAIKVKA